MTRKSGGDLLPGLKQVQSVWKEGKQNAKTFLWLGNTIGREGGRGRRAGGGIEPVWKW